MPKPCTFPGCELLNSKGNALYCHIHYKRLRRHGDPAKRVRISTRERLAFLQALVDGPEIKECVPYPFSATIGYVRYARQDGKGREAVHRTVCEMRNGPPPFAGAVSAHSCGNGRLGCVNPWHVSWKTAKGNAEDTVSHGRSVRGRKNRGCKLREDQVLEIRALPASVPIAEVADRFSISPSNVSMIRRRLTWGWLQSGASQ